eukprot:1118017-Amphidinium_carterae.1
MFYTTFHSDLRDVLDVLHDWSLIVLAVTNIQSMAFGDNITCHFTPSARQINAPPPPMSVKAK